MIMKQYLEKKTAAFYLTVAAAVLTLLGLLFYLGSRGNVAAASALLVGSILAEVVLIAGTGIVGNKPLFELTVPCSALLLVGGIMLSLPNQIDAFGFFVSGLYTFAEMRNTIFYLAASAVALVLYIISSFMCLSRE